MDLFYDERDDSGITGQRLSWLEDVGARPSAECDGEAEGFLFAATSDADDYCRLIAGRPHLEDQPGDRLPLLSLLDIHEKLEKATVGISSARIFGPVKEIDHSSLNFPVILRSDITLSEPIHKTPIHNANDLNGALKAESDHGNLLVQSWVALKVDARNEIDRLRIWLVDGKSRAWSQENQSPAPKMRSIDLLQRVASQKIAPLYGTRCLVVDFAPLQSGGWIFYDAGPGSKALSRHEDVFKSVALRLLGRRRVFEKNEESGVFV